MLLRVEGALVSQDLLNAKHKQSYIFHDVFIEQHQCYLDGFSRAQKMTEDFLNSSSNLPLLSSSTKIKSLIKVSGIGGKKMK
jgi:hypothetical protein